MDWAPENENLPSYVVLKDGLPVAGAPIWGSGFLPSNHQGVEFRGGKTPIHFLNNPEGTTSEERRAVVDAVKELNGQAYQYYRDPEIETRISQYELAYRMQTSVPELVDLNSEPEHILQQYGLSGAGRAKPNSSFARKLFAGAAPDWLRKAFDSFRYSQRAGIIMLTSIQHCPAASVKSTRPARP